MSEPRPVTIAFDVMGSDHGPLEIVRGAAQLTLDTPHIHALLVGDRALIDKALHEVRHNAERVAVHHAPDFVAMHEKPNAGLEAKPNASVIVAARLVKEGEADAMVSAGNTGACVAAAMLHMRRLPGVLRPGISVTIPAFHNNIVLIDAGANPEPKAEHLWQYGVMADVMARKVLKLDNPRVAMMNIGSEEAKGTGIIKQTRDLLKATPGMNYIGYIEGRDFFEGVADVVVTDGLVGNTLLKAAEGMAKSLFKAIAAEMIAIDPSLVSKFEPVVKSIYAKNDYHEYGGAPLLGVNGACFVAHGSSEPRTIRAAIRNCRIFHHAHVNEAIVARLAEVAPVLEAYQQRESQQKEGPVGANQGA